MAKQVRISFDWNGQTKSITTTQTAMKTDLNNLLGNATLSNNMADTINQKLQSVPSDLMSKDLLKITATIEGDMVTVNDVFA